jgi:hypothetical protein
MLVASAGFERYLAKLTRRGRLIQAKLGMSTISNNNPGANRAVENGAPRASLARASHC